MLPAAKELKSRDCRRKLGLDERYVVRVTIEEFDFVESIRECRFNNSMNRKNSILSNLFEILYRV